MLKIISIVAIVAASLVSGCMSPQKFEYTIGAIYHSRLPVHELKLGKNVVENTDSLRFFGAIAIARDPEIIENSSDFWRKEATLKCRLNDSVGLALVNNRLNQNKDTILSLLGGRHLEINFLSIPHSFHYYLAANDMFDLHAFGKISDQYIEPVHKDLKVSYVISENGVATKTGTIAIPDVNRKLTNTYATARRLLRDYLGEYKIAIDQMTDSLVKKLEQEIPSKTN